MLIVRQEQFEKMIRHSEADFVNYLFDDARRNHTEAVAKRDDATLRKMIRTGIKRAANYGIERVEGTRRFLGMMFEIAPNFDEHEAIKAILEDQTLPPEKRLDNLESAIAPEVWEEARNHYNEKAWFPKNKKPGKS